MLIATDVLSEGHNLQDCAIIVNYDLPWAIIRLIQRAGRVDRIGQKAEKILCYSLLPAEGVERIINLRDRLRQRLQENAEVVGTDETFFEDDSQGVILNLYNEKSGILDDAEDTEVDLTSEAFQIWKKATDNNLALKKMIEEMPIDTLNRQLRSGIGDNKFAELVVALWTDERLCIVSEETEKGEPQIICSLGLFKE